MNELSENQISLFTLPLEIQFQIFNKLELVNLVKLTLSSKKIQFSACRDDIWKPICYQTFPYLNKFMSAYISSQYYDFFMSQMVAAKKFLLAASKSSSKGRKLSLHFNEGKLNLAATFSKCFKKNTVKFFWEQPKERRIILRQACENQSLLALQYAISLNYDLNQYTNHSDTTLLHGTPHDHFGEMYSELVIKWLLLNGANMELKNLDSSTPLMQAIRKKKNTLVQIFIDHGANVHTGNNCFKSPLHAIPQTDIMQLLIKNGADVNLKDMADQTPIFFAIYGNNIAAVKLLLDNGADVFIKDRSGQLPIDYAKEINACYEIQSLLQESMQKARLSFLRTILGTSWFANNSQGNREPLPTQDNSHLDEDTSKCILS